MSIQGFSTPTPFGFGAGLRLTKGTTVSDVMMGDLVLLQEEVNTVMSALLITESMSRRAQPLLWDDRTSTSCTCRYGQSGRPGSPVSRDWIHRPCHAAPSRPGSGTGHSVDTEKLAKLIGHPGEPSGAVYKITHRS